ncbi:ribosome-associated translation inhibitor RaiA [Candidatus Aerophobetes bacterium]|nr:ribosome-associated translation inhibitor RaiA [Candidatus Aerophobetes bacterium]
MQVEISGIHIPITEGIDEYIKKKLGKLNKYLHQVSSARIVLKVEKGRYLAEVNVISNRFTIHGNGVASDLYASIDTAIDKVNRQAKRHKEKIQSHRSRGGLKEVVSTSRNLSSDTQPKIIQVIRKIAKPMNVDEAAIQLDLEGNIFLVFLNRDTNQVNVIYKRNGGDFGLIEPQL